MGWAWRIALLVGMLALGTWALLGRINREIDPVMVDRLCPPRTAAEAEKPVAGDTYALCRYRADNARLLASGEPVRTVFLGDSITDWWRDDDPGLFQSGLVNRGIAGQASDELLLRFRQDVIALRPRVVHLQTGTNDIAGNTGRTDPDAFLANVESMIDLARANGIEPVIASLPAIDRIPHQRHAEATQRAIDLNRRLAALAGRRGVVFADYHAVLAGADGKPRPGLTTDGLHPSPAGYAAMRTVLDRALAQAESRAAKGPR